MVILKSSKQFVSWALIFALMFLSAFVSTSMVGAYSCKSGDTECEAAKNNMLNNQSAVVENKRKANSVAEIIDEITSNPNLFIWTMQLN